MVIKLWSTGPRNPSRDRLILGDAQRGLRIGIFLLSVLYFPSYSSPPLGNGWRSAYLRSWRSLANVQELSGHRFLFFFPYGFAHPISSREEPTWKGNKKEEKKKRHSLDPGRWACVPCTTRSDDPHRRYLIPLGQWMLSLLAEMFHPFGDGLWAC